ncbi:hypothetical protein D5S18_23815 [Nocardia panacis]|uniref:Uncharacterized protein n=1 Tax=Nocardia panacis TaxID=2340916 RepID=A0A3A4JYD5_9NOCA|nr:hypothetical protein D5S18_23815 [Nocardia panacis]
MHTDTENRRHPARRGERHHLDHIAEANLDRGRSLVPRAEAAADAHRDNPDRRDQRHNLEHLAEANSSRRRRSSGS